MTWIIFQREYLNIVRKRSFLLSTFLVPLGFALIFGIQIVSMLVVEKESYKVWVMQEVEPLLAPSLTSSEQITYELTSLPLDSLQRRVLQQENELVLILPGKLAIDKINPSLSFTLYSKDNITEGVLKEIREDLRQAIRAYKLQQAGLTEDQLAQLDFSLEANTQKWTSTGESKQTHTFLASAVGYIVGFLTYMLMAIYGSILMQGIIEEKANRIVEVIVSSVQPFKLLLGKILAIGSVGITQFLLWAILSLVVMLGMQLVVGSQLEVDQIQQPGMSLEESEAMMSNMLVALQNFDWGVLWFVPFYFLGGFFLYGSLFAAAGASVDNIQDAQQFTLPITIPMLLPLLFVYNIIQTPNGSFAVFASLFPFFSPMSMLVRMSLTQVPAWQIALSMLLLVATFLGCVWLAAKIYRVGILMYGKKPSFREVIRWIRHH
ncbi:MAG: ABC transporter permease [Bacteroidetes bacterium]|nr:MAG: ABC transporter permease [Bacteroidota bacterium]